MEHSTWLDVRALGRPGLKVVQKGLARLTTWLAKVECSSGSSASSSCVHRMAGTGAACGNTKQQLHLLDGLHNLLSKIWRGCGGFMCGPKKQQHRLLDGVRSHYVWCGCIVWHYQAAAASAGWLRHDAHAAASAFSWGSVRKLMQRHNAKLSPRSTQRAPAGSLLPGAPSRLMHAVQRACRSCPPPR